MTKRNKNRSDSGTDVEFMGWEKTLEGTRVALFTITADEHPFRGCIVSEPTLRSLDFVVPQIPIRESNTNEFRSSINERKMREG